MKTLILLFLPLFCSAQVVIPEFQRNVMIHTSSYALTGGFVSDINESTFTGGVVLKQYEKHIKAGVRIQVQIPINELLAFQTFADSFWQKNTDYESKFLEMGAGVALTVNNFQVSLLYQMADYNPVKHKLTQDGAILKAGYQIRWNNY